MMKDKDHYEFVKAFDGIVKSITLINIPNNECNSKGGFKKKLNKY